MTANAASQTMTDTTTTGSLTQAAKLGALLLPW